MSFPRYPSYKDSGVEWLGQVPEHWEVKPLYGCADERYESNKGMIDNNLLSLSYGRIVVKDMASNDGLLPESFETYQIIRRGDIVFRLTDLQNDKRSLRSALVEEDGIITSAYLAVTPRGADSRYMAYLFRAYDNTKVFYSMGGGLRQSMKYSDVKRLPTVLAPVSEQTAIAEFLDRETGKIDELVAEQRRLMELLKEKRQAVISHAVTRGLNPAAPLKPSGIEWLGDVPAHWDLKPLKFVAKVGNGSTPNREVPEYWDESGFPWLNSSVVNKSIVTEAEGFVTERALNECHLPIIEPPAILVGITGQGRTRGMSAMLGITATINQHVAYVKPSTSEIDVHFLLRSFEMAYGKLRRDSEEAGATKGAITCEQIGNLRVPFPHLAEQQAVVTFLDSELAKFDTLTAEAQRAIDLLQERRTALISAAVTGQIDVRGGV